MSLYSKPSVQMSREEIRDYLTKPRSVLISAEEAVRSLEEPREGRLVTVDPEGAPHVVPVWFEFDGSSVWVSTPKKSVKVRNIMKNDRVALIVDERSYGLRQRAVIIRGRAELVEEGAREFAAKMYEKYLDARLLNSLDIRESMSLPRYKIRIIPTKILAWDYTKVSW